MIFSNTPVTAAKLKSISSVASPGETETTPSPSHKQHSSPYLLAHWRGELSLARSYWINGILLTVLIGVAVALLEDPLSRLSIENAVLVGIVLTAIATLVTIWQWVGIWRSAANTKRETGRKFWPNVAQVLVVLGVFLNAGNVITMGSDWVNLLIALRDPDLADFRIERFGETDLIFEGAINDSSVDEIISALSDPLITILRVNSQGGLTDPAMRLARYIRAHEIFVMAEEYCLSSCIFLLAASPYAAVLPGTEVGLHAAEPVVEFQTREFREENSQSLRESFTYYREFDVADWAIERTKVEKFWTPTIDEQIRMGLIVNVYDPEAEEFVLALEYCAEHEAQCGQ